MLTPQEVADKKFGKAFMGGYDMSVVDDFLETLTEDYTSLYKENALLKNKIRVLVDKLEEYRSVDESMRKTWREAQKNAEEMIVSARGTADKMIADAKKETEERLAETNRQIETEEYRLSTARQQTITFVNSLREIYQRQIEQLSVIPTIDTPPQTPRQTREEAASKAAFEIEQSVMAQIEDTYDAAPEDDEADTRDFPLPDTSAAAPAEGAPKAETYNVIHTREGGFYGPDGNQLDDDEIRSFWEPEQDTEIPRPRFDDFPDLESQFGLGAVSNGKKVK
ncbi:MAG: DivIVA domain-containing protein [Oscillospiraceae bacterium]|nr:DivIVA domain-containing protein [Oscillospiraceae bacterium]